MSGVYTPTRNGQAGHFDLDEVVEEHLAVAVSAVPATFADEAAVRTYLNTLVGELEAGGLVVAS